MTLETIRITKYPLFATSRLDG